ncbi:MAG TPA: ATP synthase F0 subunit B, partial [Candidatus Binataceae bacterium]|nr:ATP synthase F0 subunit B [Candidatus Binataceae bacterium]
MKGSELKSGLVQRSVKVVSRVAITFLFCAVVLCAQETTETNGGSEALKWVNFAILLAGLGYLCAKLFPPFFRSRTAEIQRGIIEAQAIKKEADARAAEMETRLNSLGAEIENFRRQSQSEMEQEGARIRQDTERQMVRIQQQGQAEIETAGKIARRELQAYAAKLSLDLAAQRIRQRL